MVIDKVLGRWRSLDFDIRSLDSKPLGAIRQVGVPLWGKLSLGRLDPLRPHA